MPNELDFSPTYPPQVKKAIWDRMHDDESLLKWLHSTESELVLIQNHLTRLQKTIIGVITVMEGAMTDEETGDD